MGMHQLSAASLCLDWGPLWRGTLQRGPRGKTWHTQSVGSIHLRVLSTKNSVPDHQAELEVGALA